jgi:hypothetical protein
MSTFFKERGVETLAGMAHPTNTYKTGEYRVDYNSVWIKIYYEGFTTELELKRLDNLFTDITIISDDDFISPFIGVELIKDIAYNAIKDDTDKKNKSLFEEAIKKTFENMDGEDLACLVITLDWLGY